jgi:hypothetical protein
MQAEFNPNLYNINLAGMMVGNGCTNWNVDTSPALPETLYNFQIIPKRVLDSYEANDCKYYGNPTFGKESTSPACLKAEATIQKLIYNLNIYDLYRAVYPTTLLDKSKKLRAEGRMGSTVIGGEVKTYKRGMTMSEYTPWLKNKRLTAGLNEEEEPILGDYFTDYMNRADVRKAFNIPDSVQPWEQCTNNIDYHELDECSMWIYPVLRHQTRMMFYSGDTDGAVPTYGSKQWIGELNWPVEEEWRPWFTNGQVSGYVERYDGLDFVTVKGVGHMAPQWARQPVQDMILAWIHDETF